MFKKIVPTITLILFILGSIYLGWATPTEAASIGVVFSILISCFAGTLNMKALKNALIRTVITTCYIAWIVLGASFLSVTVAYLGLTRNLCNFVDSLGLSPIGLIAILTVLYLILGCLMDGISIVVMSVPITLPMVTMAGFDPIWFGIYLVLMIQIANITPPVGFNLYIIQGLTGLDIMEVSRYILPFLIIIVIFTFFITIYPDIVLFLPRTMIR